MDITALLFAAALAQQSSCESLRTLALNKATITAAEPVAARRCSCPRIAGSPSP
jgi:hypothetical protein